MDITIVSEDKPADAVLHVNLNSWPRRASFHEGQKVYYEAAKVTGTASLALKGYAAKKTNLYGNKHYYSTNYYPYSNTDPKKPLLFAAKRAFMKMFVDLWGPESLPYLWQTTLAHVFSHGNWDELDEVIKKEDQHKAVPVIMKTLSASDPTQKNRALQMLQEFTRQKEFATGGRKPRIERMTANVRKAVLDDIHMLIQAAADDSQRFAEAALDILACFGQDASAALPVIREQMNSADAVINRAAFRAMGAIASPEGVYQSAGK